MAGYDAFARRFKGKIVVRAAQFQVIAKALAAPRLPDIKAHVTYRVVGMEHRWTVSLWDESRIWDPGD